jgi:hypothetical protein
MGIMKNLLRLMLFATWTLSLWAQSRPLDQGTITKMRMAECASASHPLMAALTGTPPQVSAELCPEYTLVTDKVVYRIIGRNSGNIIPLSETTAFHLQKNEMLIRIDDARNETRFTVLEMTLRRDWERDHQRMEAQKDAAARQRLDLDFSEDEQR